MTYDKLLETIAASKARTGLRSAPESGTSSMSCASDLKNEAAAWVVIPALSVRRLKVVPRGIQV